MWVSKDLGRPPGWPLLGEAPGSMAHSLPEEKGPVSPQDRWGTAGQQDICVLVSSEKSKLQRSPEKALSSLVHHAQNL